MTSWSKLLMFSILLSLLFPTSILFANASDNNVVSIVLTNAEEISASAYEAVLEAEQAGINVSSLLDKLNLGGENLAEAYVWYHLGNSDNANDYASLCFELMENVRSEALELTDEAKILRETDFFVTVVGSGFSMVIVVVFCFFAWRVFRRRYLRRVLRSRPEVVSSES